MLLEVPIVTKREIVRAYTSQSKTPDSAMRTLRSKQAVSEGIEAPVRAAGGRLGGSVHVYCAINRDAARAVRLKQLELAHQLAERAGRIERSSAMRRLIERVSGTLASGTYEGLAAALSRPDLAKDLAAVSRQIAAARRELQSLSQTTVMHGHVTKLDDPFAFVTLDEGKVPMPVPAQMLRDRGVAAAKGTAVTAWWEYDRGELRLTVEPAVEIAGSDAKDSSDEPAVDLYGTPWGTVLNDDGIAYALARLAEPRHTIRRPRVPITIED